MTKQTLYNFSPELQELFKKYDPMTYLVDQARKVEGIDNAYEEVPVKLDKNKPTVFLIIGPSGSGKDTSMELIIKKGKAEHIVTATTRTRRIDENEPEDKYTWIHEPRLTNESDINYKNRVAEKYNLLESDFHHGNVYGLPEENLEKVVNKGVVGVIRTENRGAATIKNKLKDRYNIITVFITAPDYQTLINRISDREGFEIRMEKAPLEVKDAKGNVNYILVNPDDQSGDRELGERKTAENMLKLFNSLIS